MRFYFLGNHCAIAKNMWGRILSYDPERRRMIGVNWSKDIDQTLAAAKEQLRPILLDFQRGSGMRSLCSAGWRVV